MLFKDKKKTGQICLAFYRSLGKSGAGAEVLTEKEEEVARGFLNLTWDLTAGLQDRGVFLRRRLFRDGLSATGERHYRDQERILESDLVAQYTPIKVAVAARDALIGAGVGTTPN